MFWKNLIQGVLNFIANNAIPLIIAIILFNVIHWVGGFFNESPAPYKEALKTVSKDVQIEEKQNEIRNNRPDVNGVIKRLRSHSF